LYTSSLPPVGSSLCTPQILCSLLQLARPYQVDGLLEATVERLHQILDGRNAAAVFNAAAMAAGGGRGTGFISGPGGTLEALNGAHAAASETASAGAGTTTGTDASQNSHLTSDSSDTEHGTTSALSTASGGGATSAPSSRGIPLRINTNLFGRSHHRTDRDREDSISNASTATSASSYDHSDSEFTGSESQSQSRPRRVRRDTDAQLRPHREIWTGDLSSVIGLQKRGLRGLMEGRRLMRERNAKPGSSGGLTSLPATAVDQSAASGV
jgi:hypothetical protein